MCRKPRGPSCPVTGFLPVPKGCCRGAGPSSACAAQLLFDDGGRERKTARHAGLGIGVNGRFFFSTGHQSRKARNLASNRQCVVCTEESAQAVIVEGIAAELSDPALFKRLAPVYQRKYKPWKLDQELGPVFEVRPRVIFGLREATFKASTRWIFEDER